MNAARARAYGHVLSILEELPDLDAETVAPVREAADAALFAADGDSARDAADELMALQDVLDRAVQRGRLDDEAATQLIGAVESCGPELLIV